MALQNFIRLSRNVHLYTPPTAPTPSSTAPNLILLCAWLGAPDRAIAKYTAGYTTLYPAARILLITCTQRNFTLPSSSSLAPATELLPRTRVLAHAFSNGGAHQLITLSHRLRAPLPISALILDSAPGSAEFWTATAGFVASLAGMVWWRRWIATAMAYLGFGFGTLVCWILRWKPPIARVREGLNDERIVGREVPRTYIHGPGDRVVSSKDVREHVEEARKRGFRVREDVVLGSGHVAHIRAGPERYWKIVEETWEAVERGY